jgi:hypothetical protein
MIDGWPSPFPGMDPWLERHWGAIHSAYVQLACAQVAARLPEDLFAEAEEAVYVVDVDAGMTGQVRPDVAVFGSDRSDEDDGVGETATTAGVAVARPIRIPLSVEPAKLRHVAIRSIEGGEPLITAIELTSPRNKVEARGRKQYRRKRLAYYDACANVVEIDLLRAGRPLIDVPWEKVGVAELAPYRAVVRRAADAGPLEAEYYPMPLRERLPVIRVPLRGADGDVALDLQQPLDQIYARGRYDNRIDYRNAPAPPLPPADAAWAAERIAGAGRGAV